MIVTYSSGVFTIESTKLSNFAIIDKATITSKINCCDPEYSDEVEAGDVTANAFTLDSTFFSTSEVTDGIYSFNLTVEYNNGDKTTEELGCYFVDEETACLVADKVSGNIDVNTPEGRELLLLEMDYFLLKNAANGCPCECSDFCMILERVWKAVDKVDCDICGTETCTEC